MKNEWTKEEREAGIWQAGKLAMALNHSSADAAIELACERNMLRSALEATCTVPKHSPSWPCWCDPESSRDDLPTAACRNAREALSRSGGAKMSVSASKTAKLIRHEFEGAITELGANKTLNPRDPYNEGFNAGVDLAIQFIRTYIAGKGLFQL